MERLKLTTTKGKTFLGAFVYSSREAKERLEKLNWLVRKREGKPIGQANLESIEVSSYPELAIFTKNDLAGDGHKLTQKARRVETLWERLYRRG